MSELQGTKGWLLVYLIGSIPLLIIYSMGLSGWFFEYPIPLMATIFAVLAVPLLLLVVKSARAPQWNIALVWGAATLITLRSISVFAFPGDGGPMSGDQLSAALTSVTVIVTVAIAWAIVWTHYFRRSERVKKTFSSSAVSQ